MATSVYPFFVDPSEQSVAELGSGFIQSYLGNGSLSKGFAVVTQRRVYFNGKSYFKDFKGRWKQQMQAKTVDLKDVTGTGYVSVRILGLLIGAIAVFFWTFPMDVIWGIMGGDVLESIQRKIQDPTWWMLSCIPAAGMVAAFFLRRRTLFNIEFAGGNISFNTSWYGKDEIDHFQKELRKAMAVVKDQVPVSQSATAAVHTATSTAPATPAGVTKDKAQTLREIAKLKEDGIITENEFQQMKADLMSGDK